MGRVVYDPVTRTWKSSEPAVAAIPEVQAPAGPQAEVQNTETVNAETEQPVRPLVQTQEQQAEAKQPQAAANAAAPQQANQQVAAGSQQAVPSATTSDLDLNVQAIMDAQRAGIQAQKDAAANASAAEQKGIDAFASYVDQMKAEQEQNRLSAEEMQKKARRELLVGGIADGLTALANLYYTTKGAPNAQLTTGLDKYQAIYDRAKERRAQLQRELNLRLQQGNLSLAQMRAKAAGSDAERQGKIAAAEAALPAEAEKLRQQNAAAAEKRRQDADKIARDQDHWDKTYELQKAGQEEAARAHRASESLSRQRLAAETSRRKDADRKATYGEDMSRNIGKHGVFHFGTKQYVQQLPTVVAEIASDRLAKIEKAMENKPDGTTDRKWQRSKAYKELQSQKMQIEQEYEELEKPEQLSAYVDKYLNESNTAQASLAKLSDDYTGKKTDMSSWEEKTDDSTPPSKREKTDKKDDNTPPSRR